MIVVSHNDGEIKIEGHAEYAPEGQDIVCAGVSELTQSLFCRKVMTDNTLILSEKMSDFA